jgi:cell division protein WhiA
VSLSASLRAELAAIELRNGCCRLAELSALFHVAGSIHLLGRGRLTFHLDLSDAATARRAFTLLRGLGVTSEIRTYRQRSFDRATRYQLHVPGEPRALQVLHEAGVVDARLAPMPHPPKRVTARPCCRSAYLRGALLGAGSLTGPPSRHLEIRTAGIEGAAFLARLAEAVGAPLAVVDRGRHAAAYAKGEETIDSVLAAAGASDTVLSLAERAVIGQTRATANRLANADHANLVRAGRAAHVQIRAVRRLAATGALEDLPAALQEAARLRLRYPTLSLRELAGRASPPVTKATLHRRLGTLVRLAGD